MVITNTPSILLILFPGVNFFSRNKSKLENLQIEKSKSPSTTLPKNLSMLACVPKERESPKKGVLDSIKVRMAFLSIIQWGQFFIFSTKTKDLSLSPSNDLEVPSSI